MLCIESLRYNIGLKCKYAKVTNNKNDLAELIYAKIDVPKLNFKQNIS